MKKSLSKLIIFAFLINMLMVQSVFAEGNSSYIIDDNSYPLGIYIEAAKKEGKHDIKIAVDMASPEDTVIDSGVKSISGWQKKTFFDEEGPKVRELGRNLKQKIYFPSGINVKVSNIKFKKFQNKDGVFAVIDKGATVRFTDCEFSNTVVNNGTAIFENCTFETEKIENNGTATYEGTTKEPVNTGNPSVNPSFVPLSMNLVGEQLASVLKNTTVDRTFDIKTGGTKKAEAIITADVTPKDKGIETSIESEKLKIKGAPLEAVAYSITVTAKATDSLGNPDIVTKTVTLNVQEPLVAEIRGQLQAYTTENNTRHSNITLARTFSVDAVAMASGGGGGLGPDTPQDKVNLFLKEGNGEFIPYIDFMRKYPDAKISYSISPEGSGMKASTVYDSIILSGTPSKKGKYKLFANVEQGSRKVVSNGVEFRIYDKDVTLESRLKELPEQLKDWDMEPYTISIVGNAIIPKSIKNIYGSHQSGVYGTIGNYQSFATETLVVPKDADVTFTNMKFFRSVKIVVEKGGKLTLDDSVAFGPIEVNGGTFSMRNSSSLVNSLTLNEGSVLDNADIKSHGRYLTDGPISGPDTPVVVKVKGNIKIKGKNIIKGENGDAKLPGQVAMEVENSTVTLEDGSELSLYGGGDPLVPYAGVGGDALNLKDGKIKGHGKLEAFGGIGHGKGGQGGKGIEGKGSVEVDTVIAKGGDGHSEYIIHGKGKGGDGVSSDITIKADKIDISGGIGEPAGTPSGTPVDKPLYVNIIPMEYNLEGYDTETYNIYFTSDKNTSEVIEPGKEMEVTVELKKVSTDNLEIFHLNSSGNLENIKDFSVKGNKVTFKNDEFSPYIFANKSTVGKVEKHPKEEAVSSESLKNKSVKASSENISKPLTGDKSNIYVYGGILLATIIVIVWLIIRKKK